MREDGVEKRAMGFEAIANQPISCGNAQISEQGTAKA
jgi:hypothetical protein